MRIELILIEIQVKLFEMNDNNDEIIHRSNILCYYDLCFPFNSAHTIRILNYNKNTSQLWRKNCAQLATLATVCGDCDASR